MFKKIKKKILPLLAIGAIASSLLVPLGVYAYTGGLLNGITPTVVSGSVSYPVRLTDNVYSSPTGFYSEFNIPAIVRFELGGVYVIDKIVLKWYNAGSTFKFYDSYGNLLRSYSSSEIATGAYANNSTPPTIKDIPDISGVKRIEIVHADTSKPGQIYEFDVLVASDTTPPAVPTGLTVTGDDGSASLDWNENTELDLRGYNVYQSTDNVNFTKITASPITTSKYTVTGLMNGTTYYFAVTAVDTSGNESARSSSVSVTPVADTTPPGDVTNLKASATDTTVDLTFTNPAEADFAGTKLYLNGVLKAILDKTKTSYTFTNLEPNTTYTIKVTAFDTSGNESNGITTTVKTKIPLAEDVTDLSADAKYDRVKLSWTNPDSEFFSHVKIYRKKVEQKSFWDQLFGATAVSAATTSDGYTPMFETNGTYWTDLTVTPETTYSYKVTSVNIEGNESQGVTIETTTLSEPVPVLTGVATTQNENGDYVVTWTSPIKGTVKVLIGGKEYTVVDAASQQVMIPKEDMKTDFFGGYDAKLVPVGEFGTEGQAVQVPAVQGKTIEFPILFDDFMKTVVNILSWAAPLILVSLVFIFWRPFIAFLRKTIFVKGGRMKS
ncbi:Phage protein [Geobacillus proteiniphilus]|uniref:Phage protein n=1 Tax=Geobacillus proteiniphilus TaxID=860353 RepID=A0A1Q5T9V3_9BACL|nr:fibronectin type III domain-containing protein [Geobacillus proteiniphilus]OKO97019.1 Phage protein [Geobacillus proteiniphilus]